MPFTTLSRAICQLLQSAISHTYRRGSNKGFISQKVRNAQAGSGDRHCSFPGYTQSPSCSFPSFLGLASTNSSLLLWAGAFGNWLLFVVLSPISVHVFWRSFSEVCLGGFCLFYGILKLLADVYSLHWLKYLQPLAKSEQFLSNLCFYLLKPERERYFESKLVVWKLCFEAKNMLPTVQ